MSVMKAKTNLQAPMPAAIAAKIERIAQGGPITLPASAASPASPNPSACLTCANPTCKK